MRVFLAVPSDPPWVESAGRLVARVRAETPRASWTRPEAWHLTLKFLGDLSAGMVERFARAIGVAAARVAAGELRSAGSLLLPTRGRPRVLAIRFGPTPALEGLSDLASEAEIAGRRVGVPPERRDFHPHVTLARLRDPWPPSAVELFRREADGWPLPSWPALRCVLYESRLDPAGAVHTPLYEWPFEAKTEVSA